MLLHNRGSLTVWAFLDKNTIFVEGITDKQYLQLAIKVFSHSLQEKIDSGDLIILPERKIDVEQHY